MHTAFKLAVAKFRSCELAQAHSRQTASANANSLIPSIAETPVICMDTLPFLSAGVQYCCCAPSGKRSFYNTSARSRAQRLCGRLFVALCSTSLPRSAARCCRAYSRSRSQRRAVLAPGAPLRSSPLAFLPRGRESGQLRSEGRLYYLYTVATQGQPTGPEVRHCASPVPAAGCHSSATSDHRTFVVDSRL